MKAIDTALSILKAFARKLLSRKARIRLRKIYYYGRTFKCSLCGSSVRTLIDSGSDLPILRQLNVIGGFRPMDSCPVCLAGGRTRLVGYYLQQEFLIRGARPRRVLHIAPESQLTAILKRQLANVEYIAADLDPEPYRNVMDIVRADITNLQWDKGHFDLVICNHVLEHVPDDRKAMSELFRVMRPEGTAILQVPIAGAPRETVEDPSIECADERERLFGQVDHVRIYGTDYVDRLRGAGFNVDLFNPNSWGAQVIDELRLDPRERVIIARKSK